MFVVQPPNIDSNFTGHPCFLPSRPTPRILLCSMGFYFPPYLPSTKSSLVLPNIPPYGARCCCQSVPSRFSSPFYSTTSPWLSLWALFGFSLGISSGDVLGFFRVPFWYYLCLSHWLPLLLSSFPFLPLLPFILSSFFSLLFFSCQGLT